MYDGKTDEVTNEMRAEWGRESVETFPLADEYRNEKGEIVDEDIVVDIIADILHFVDLNYSQHTPESVLAAVKLHFNAERKGGGRCV